MTKYHLLSIPGLPTSFASLDSRLYHDYQPTLGLLKEINGGNPIAFSSFIWPREVEHPLGNWTLHVPILTIPLWYGFYQFHKTWRKKIIQTAADKIKAGLKNSEHLFIMGHSHGNRITLDALAHLIKTNELPANKVTFISYAPAYSGVGFGLVPKGLKEKDLQQIYPHLKQVLVFRVKTDILSGAPPLKKVQRKFQDTPYEFHQYAPHLKEVFVMAHDTVRSRPDILKQLKTLLWLTACK
jgi:hypothetical protein